MCISMIKSRDSSFSDSTHFGFSWWPLPRQPALGDTEGIFETHDVLFIATCCFVSTMARDFIAQTCWVAWETKKENYHTANEPRAEFNSSQNLLGHIWKLYKSQHFTTNILENKRSKGSKTSFASKQVNHLLNIVFIVEIQTSNLSELGSQEEAIG